MTETTNASGGGNNGRYFSFGGFLVIVGLLSFMVFGEHIGTKTPAKLHIKVEAPKTF